MQLYDLYSKNQSVNKENIINISGHENDVKYMDLESFIEPICTIQPYIDKYENPEKILKTDNRINWANKPADIKINLDPIIVKMIDDSKKLDEQKEILSKYNKDLSLYRELNGSISGFQSLFASVKEDNSILNFLIAWENAKFPKHNYERALKEAKAFLNSLNENRWNTFNQMSHETAETLKDLLDSIATMKGFLKFLNPSWWSLKKRINSILNEYNLELTNDNIEKIASKAELTLYYTSLQEIIKYELAFVDNTNLKEQEIIDIFDKSIDLMSHYYKFRTSQLADYFSNLEEMRSNTQLNSLLNYINHISNYLNSFTQLLQFLSEKDLYEIFNDNYITFLIDQINSDQSLTDLLIQLKTEFDNFDEIQYMDKVISNLSPAQSIFLNALKNKNLIVHENKKEQWKKIITDSFLHIWLQKEEQENTILKKYADRELIKLAESNTQDKVNKTIHYTREILNKYRQIHEQINLLSFAFKKDHITFVLKLINDHNKLDDYIQKTKYCCTKDFDEIVEMDNTRNSLNDIQRELFTKVLEKWLPPDEKLAFKWEQAIRRGFLDYWIEQIELQNPILRTVSTQTSKEIIDSLEENYQKKLDANKEYIKKVLDIQISSLVSTDNIKGGKKLKDLEYQAKKQRKVWSLRKLMNEYGESHILNMLPCWLMSPEAVSAVMPYKKELFDVVIFDEASQCAPECALPSIVRAKQLVVGGDEKQLPPLDLFHSFIDTEDEEDDENIIHEATSLLGLSKAIYPTYLLSWHYRSKYEELINFSNHAFYDGKIQIAPNVKARITPPAVEWYNVEAGLWCDNCNRQEAYEVVEYINNILTQPGEIPTLGVITFNSKQQSLIMDLLDKREIEDPVFAEAYARAKQLDSDSRPFIKNIENVQGDERDLIIFSIGYARNNQGRVSTNFGLLNRQGGENRLNVAVTRAKKKIVVFCSVSYADFGVDNSKHDGPRLFKKYLEYVYHSSNESNDGITSVLQEINPAYREDLRRATLCFDSSFEEEVHNELSKRGYIIKTQIGCSGYRVDLGIIHPEHPDKFILGVECDGATYHSSLSARSRDLTRQDFLEAKGWKIERIWSRNWWKNKDNELERIVNRIKQLQSVN